jgi:hypothetical protein
LKDSEDKSLLSIIATPVLILDVIAIFLFYLGWAYTYYLYYDFGVNVSALNIPLYYFFIYALPVIYGSVFYFSLAVLIPLVVILIIKVINGHRADGFPGWLTEQSLITGVVIVSFIVMLPLSDILARKFATRTAIDMRGGNAKTIHFKFRDDPAALYPERFIKANDAGELRLLLQTNDRFIVFLQPEPDENVAELPRGSTFVVFNSDIRLANITLENVGGQN